MKGENQHVGALRAIALAACLAASSNALASGADSGDSLAQLASHAIKAIVNDLGRGLAKVGHSIEADFTRTAQLFRTAQRGHDATPARAAGHDTDPQRPDDPTRNTVASACHHTLLPTETTAFTPFAMALPHKHRVPSDARKISIQGH
ncbi:MAG: hypothetical protein PVJ40_08445 [Gammaproteobacteria bacterium]|jgi:hypothetical protein